jgi:hypothetical protein
MSEGSVPVKMRTWNTIVSDCLTGSVKFAFFTIYFISGVLTVHGQQAVSPISKGKLLFSDDFTIPENYTKEFQPLQQGWKVKAWHANFKHTPEGLESIWESGHNPVIAYECSLKNVVVEVEFRFLKEQVPPQNAYCRINLANLDLHPRSYSLSTWTNESVGSRSPGLTLEHEEWRPGGAQIIDTISGDFQPDTWYKITLEVLGSYARLSCNGRMVEGNHPKFGELKNLLVIGVGKSRHQLRNLKVYEAIKNSAWKTWQSKFVSLNSSGKLTYFPDKEGNTLPDFSNVGYGQGKLSIPYIPVVETVTPVEGDNLQHIQEAINRVSQQKPDQNGFRGAVLLKKGRYEVSGTLQIRTPGIVIRGEGSIEEGTVVCETASAKTDLFVFSGSGSLKRDEAGKVAISENYTPAGRNFITFTDASSFHPGDSVLLYRPATGNWIHDLKMDQIIERQGTKQWTADGFHLYFERIITRIQGNKVFLDNPVVMPMEKKYGGGYLMKYHFGGRIRNVGIENLRMESAFASDTAENHGWTAVVLSKVENGWVRNVTSRYFGQGCVNIEGSSRNITVIDCQCLDPKSKIKGGRRYSFNCNGQLNLVKNCYASGGRHDFVTGSRVCGPNVFTRCIARNAYADIGPHHRWSSGTLYDCIDTDGQINVQDRGNWGSGHGWAGVTQVLWNCKSPETAVQSPWVSGKNYCIGLSGGKYSGRFSDKPDGEWEGLNQPGLEPESLYEAQKNQ